MIRKNNVKEIIKSGKSAVGTFLKSNDPSIAEVVGLAGFDFFVLDNEHVAMSRDSMVNMLRAADAVGVDPIVRVRENATVEILQALDAGALGVQVPNVDTKQEAQDVISAVKYTPIGKRGFSPTTRAAGYGFMDKKEYVETSNEETLVVCHCETVQCIENLDAILTLDHLDVIFIGPMDLSQSLGVMGEANHPKVLESIDLIINKVKKANKAVGIVSAPSKVQEYIDRGVQYLLVGTDQGMIAAGAAQTLKQAGR
ncbi:MAG: 2-dehydro-3-deoxyglucarate aldolase [Tindallia sp. MSAO_Bac2]|nr:MAG: 2-dehydro-3-deoxyglucarate aldolase [Tindallia sp. MSAO_Bac2]